MFADLQTSLIKYRYKNPTKASLKHIYWLIGPLASVNLFITHPILTLGCMNIRSNMQSVDFYLGLLVLAMKLFAVTAV